MKKTVLIVITVLIGVIAFVMFNQNSAPAPDTENTEEMMEGDTMMEEGDSMMDEGDQMMDEGDSMMESEVKEFQVGGIPFEFSTDEIRVKEGDTVRIVFTSIEGFHDWVVDEFDAATKQLQAGGTDTIEFVADKKGTFEYYCSVGNHRAMGMVGTLIVE